MWLKSTFAICNKFNEMYNNLVVGQHIIEGISKFISAFFNLQLLPIDFIFNIVNLLVEFGDVHLSILKSTLCSFELHLNAVDFVQKLFFSFNSFLGGLLKSFHVLTHTLEFVLNSLQLLLSQLCSFSCSLKLILLDAKLSGEFVQFLLIVTCQFRCLSEVFVQFLQSYLIVHALALKHLNLLKNTISLFGGKSKLGDGISKTLFGLLGFFLHQHDSASEGRKNPRSPNRVLLIPSPDTTTTTTSATDTTTAITTT